ncbi:histidine phosphatase family protein [Enterococcus sp. 669A]|uniref:Histidine phosphatase family protein n=1 Tax=Candidatus Enterococcus moelleringii TaxID=2815325 RepID=A0ABS3LEC2_9ENTE|nr:histidine phosphatase family protein [Enterococcus sp. 669A]MBO1307988.1 histidine phosphatase family protein [Enterococcus sp. 669A]
MKIYFIRHGETDYNNRGLFYGSTDVSLNQTGINQALALHKKLAFLSADIPVYTSELVRTKETAQLIFPAQEKTALAGFNEKSFGLWEGMDANQIEARYPVEWQSWLDDPFEITPPEAEPFFDFRLRVLTEFEKLLRKRQDFVIVSHLGVLRVILQACNPGKTFWEVDVPQGEYQVIDTDL